MELDFNFYALFETVGFVQAITLGVLLIALNKRKYKSTIFLGLYLISLALGTLPRIFNTLDVHLFYQELYLLPFDFFWLYFPLFYLYTQHVCIFSDQKKKFCVLYPGIVAFFLQLAIFFLPFETKLYLTQSIGYDIYTFLKLGYGLGIGIYTLRLLNRHKVEVYNYFSMIKSKELTWARMYLTYAIFGFLLYTILYQTMSENLFAKLFFVGFDLILIYWASYQGVIQRNVRSLIAKKEDYDLFNDNSSEDSGTSSTEKSREELMERIHDYMISSESYIHHELTIVELAEKLNVHPKRISTTLNTVQNQNFNAYVNHFRVKKAEELLKSEIADTLSVEGIGNEVGFNSKSAFYSAFKKETGTTPSQYKKQMVA